jgi:hypothetical protein
MFDGISLQNAFPIVRNCVDLSLTNNLQIFMRMFLPTLMRLFKCILKRPINCRLIINMQQPTHHIFKTQPTIYRSVWDFHLVFNSPLFHNVYFIKAKWKQINQ